MRPRSDEDPVREFTIWARAFNARKQAVYKDAVTTNFHQHSSLQMRGSPYKRLLNDEIHLHYPFYGSRRIRDELNTQTHTVSRKKVQSLIRQMGLRALYGLLR